MRLVAVAAALFVVLLAACGGADVPLYGSELYAASCSHCHGSGLAGGVGPALGPGSPSVALSDQQIKDVVRIGPGAMTSFGDRFSEEQLDSLVEFIRTEQGE